MPTRITLDVPKTPAAEKPEIRSTFTWTILVFLCFLEYGAVGEVSTVSCFELCGTSNRLVQYRQPSAAMRSVAAPN